MAINLATKFNGYVDEKFATESKTSLVTNQDFDWTGAHTVKVYKVSTAAMGDYDRAGAGVEITSEVDGETVTQTVFPSRFGPIQGLNATTEEFTLNNDKSFTFAVDKLDNDETLQAVEAASALERQLREVVIPMIDSYVFGVLATNAGTKPDAVVLTADNIMDKILAASNALDDAEVPETERVLVVTPDTYMLMKKSGDIIMDTEIGQNMRLKGIVSNLDGAFVMKVPASRLPENFGFMLVHPCACVAPKKLEDYRIHTDPPGISGDLVEGRVCFDAFVLDNKVKAVYYQEKAAAQQSNDNQGGD